ncbi:HNH endonuclease [Metabacillus indicus]|uniref:HNH endonuclease n=1 Tax=Metabacillus indicus TaxID=246786 RepID=UPI000492F68B|nr:HNH endonuclease [Metabacillus indicus]KEZ51341.1 restriction endonuclease [Metabacillus indicus LMG 22858]
MKSYANKFYKSSTWECKRIRILKRDLYECRECKRYGKKTAASTVHHINPLLDKPELRLATWNLLSLCNRCHDKMHDRTTDRLTTLGEWWVERAERMRDYEKII